jgi:acetyl-CoA C-acetyltransferase
MQVRLWLNRKWSEAISENGILSAAHASQICDGAAPLLVVNEAGVKKTGLFTVGARVRKTGMSIQDIDLDEVNAAFAPIPLAWATKVGARCRINAGGNVKMVTHDLRPNLKLTSSQ